jgi:iron-sulfur cluster assembly accessory protein
MNKTLVANTTLTAAAEKFIRRMMRFTTSEKSGFRLKVAPGGCSGFAVTFDVVAEPDPKELVWTPSGLRIFLDPSSCLLLDGATVDFTETLANTGFVVTTQNPAGACCSSAPKSQAPTLVSIGSSTRS